jgi:hypothetical protein
LNFFNRKEHKEGAKDAKLKPCKAMSLRSFAKKSLRPLRLMDFKSYSDAILTPFFNGIIIAYSSL